MKTPPEPSDTPAVPVPPFWVPMQASVRGAAHIRKGLPNEDATAWQGFGVISAIAVADGHGDPACPRAQHGSRLAAQTAVELLVTAATTLPGVAAGSEPASAEAVEALLATEIVPEIVGQWRTRVLYDAATHELTSAELTAALRRGVLADEPAEAAAGEHPPGPDADGPPDPVPGPVSRSLSMADLDEASRVRAYGTTLVAALTCPGWVLVVQVGDGECGIVLGSGTDLAPVPDDGYVGTVTTSMALPDAVSVARVAAVPAGEQVVATWVCTDGFSAAQADPSWRSLVAQQLFELATSMGPPAVAEKLPGWLGPAAATGGDDTSMAITIDGMLAPVAGGSGASSVAAPRPVTPTGSTLPMPARDVTAGETTTLSDPHASPSEPGNWRRLLGTPNEK